MRLPIVTLPTPSLRVRSGEVDHATLRSPEIQQFIKDMIPTMYDDDGIGLAAPQVGKNIRICVVGKDATPTKQKDLVLVNPVWERTSRKTNIDAEGCLSVPNVFGKVKRYSYIHVTAWNEHGEELSFDANNFFARVIQHEVDHLDGILFIDKARDIYEVDPEERKNTERPEL